jgi:predicted ATPase
LERVAAQQIYQPEAFFVGGLGFIEPSAARRISFEDAIRFERVPEQPTWVKSGSARPRVRLKYPAPAVDI